MKPAPFEYHLVRSVVEAVTMLGELDDAKLLAGGQSLMPMMNMRFVSPAHVIDINGISGLAELRVTGDRLTVGALARQATLLQSELVSRCCPLIGYALCHTGHVQTRSRGTIGGSLCHLDPAAELPVVALTLGATLTVQGPSGQREVSFVDWPLMYMTPALSPDEMLVAVSFPLRQRRQGDAFVEFSRRRGDFAVACVGCSMQLDDMGAISSVAIALGGVGATVLRLGEAEALLRGRRPALPLFSEAAAFVERIESSSDAYFTASYRTSLAKALIAQALGIAAERALHPEAP